MNDAPRQPLSRWLWRQRWLPRQLRKLGYKRLGETGQAPDAPFTMDFFGLRYAGNLRNNVEFSMYFYGAFEKPLLYFMRDALSAMETASSSRSLCCCDIGANIGQHSLFLSRYAARVHAFEPFPEVSGRLKAHMTLNDIDNIVLHEVGLGERNERLPFYAPTGGNQGIGSFLDSSTSRGNSPIGELRVVRGDDYFPEQGIDAIHLIKIDVEGLEREVMIGLRQTLIEHRPLLICEISYGEANSFPNRTALLDCLPPDYALYIFDTRKHDGSTARRRGANAKRSGRYRLLEFDGWRERDQDDVVAIPRELIGQIPLQGPPRRTSSHSLNLS